MDSYGDEVDNSVRYPRLRSFVVAMRIYAYLCLAIGVFAGAYGFTEDSVKMMGWLLLAAGLLAQSFFFLIAAEIPLVFMDTEQNTRNILVYLEREAMARRVNDPKGNPAVDTRTADLASRVPKAK